MEPFLSLGGSPTQSTLISPRVLFLGLLASLAFCTLVVHAVFGKIVAWGYTPLAIALSLPMAAVGIRSIAETDYNPESAISMHSYRAPPEPSVFHSTNWHI